MPNDMPISPRQPRSASAGGGFWLGLAIVGGAVAAVYLFAPGIPRQMFGGSSAGALGDEPGGASSSHMPIAERESAPGNILTRPGSDDRIANPAPGAPQPGKGIPDAPVLPKITTYRDEATAQGLLLQAEKAYKVAPSSKDWSAAISAARKISGLNAKPTTMVRAKDIIRGSEATAKLFNDLAERDELRRNFDTDPQLLLINRGGAKPDQAVPIANLESKEAVKGDPVAWVDGQRRTGKVTVMLRGGKDFFATVLRADEIGEVTRADLVAITASKQREFDERLAKLKNGDLADNALAWYEAAKFAYQNRLDDQVAAMMDRAMLLDPLLAQSVREDKAASLYAKVILHLHNDNRTSAEGFMRLIKQRFADTPSGKEAQAYFDAKTTGAGDAALRAARQQAEELEAAAIRQRQEEIERRAEETGDADELAAARKKPASGSESGPAAPLASGTEAQADAMFDTGSELYSQAVSAGNTSARDKLAADSITILTKARDIYQRLIEENPGNAALEAKGHECNQIRYDAIKIRRPRF